MKKFLIIFLIIICLILLFFHFFLWHINKELDKFDSKLIEIEKKAREILIINKITLSLKEIKNNVPERTEKKSYNQDSIAITIYSNCIKYDLWNSLVLKQIKIESNWNPSAISPKGAKGLMQIMPVTASIYSGLFFEGKNFDLFNPYKNIALGTKILSDNISLYGLKGGLACYNGGSKQAHLYAQNRACKETRKYINQILEDL